MCIFISQNQNKILILHDGCKCTKNVSIINYNLNKEHNAGSKAKKTFGTTFSERS